MIDAPEPRTLVADLEQRLEELDALPDAQARGRATAAVQALLDLYGAGLERIVDEIAARDDGQLAEALADDELVAHLLLLHGLHPIPLEERVRSALEQVRPYLESHGGNVELIEIDAPSVRLRLEGSCSGCPSSTMTLKLAIENAIHKEAPEIENVVADGAVEPRRDSLIQLEISPGLVSAGTSSGPKPMAEPDASDPAAWAMAGGMAELSGGGTVVKPVGGQPILFLKIGQNFYGYRPICPACEHSLSDAALTGTELTCAGCANRYDALRAGRCLDRPQLHLEPVPLLVGDDGLVKVALAAAA